MMTAVSKTVNPSAPVGGTVSVEDEGGLGSSRQMSD